ncbi:MAG: RHS repeat-associated core domain-containing protein [Pseudomonadota bacterium]
MNSSASMNALPKPSNGRSVSRSVCLSVALLFLSAGFVVAQDEEITYYHWDALGSPVLATNESGAPKWREEYAPYGGRLLEQSREREDCGSPPCEPTNSPWENRNFFTGKYDEADTGLTYFGARWYDPSLGRFLSVDPVEFSTDNVFSFNRYAYVNNNPYSYVDPDGRAAEIFWDGLNVTMGLTSLTGNVQAGNYGSALVDFIGVLVDGTAAAFPFVPGGAATGIRGIREGKSFIDALPKPPTGPGTVPKKDRDPKRLFTPSEREAKRAEQDFLCANGCGTRIDSSNSAGHHKVRHADGGPTTSDNHAEVCVDCHKRLHRGGEKE